MRPREGCERVGRPGGVKRDIRVGISGWRYGGWRADFYPAGLRQADELRYASERMSAIEINGTFYSMQRSDCFVQWRTETPPDFVFAVKGSRYITHMLKLNSPAAALGNFFAQGVLALSEKLGPVLWQLPPGLAFHPGKLEAFLKMLPTSGEEAAEVARGHDHRLKGEPWLAWDGVEEIRHALEVRHPSFLCPEFAALLREHNIASVVSDSAGKFPVLDDVTADFVYVRLHGHEHLYSGGYGDALLRKWAERIRAWNSGAQVHGNSYADAEHRPPRKKRDVFVFFDNDAKVDAPKDAMRLQEILGGG